MSHNPEIPYNDLPLLPPKGFDSKNSILSDANFLAIRALGELKGLTLAPINLYLLISPIALLESVDSSKIEDVHTTIEEVLQNDLFPEMERRAEDKEVLRYRDAVLWGKDQLDKMPITSRVINGIQKILIPDSPGGFRKQQNKITNPTTGEVFYTPPEVPHLNKLMSNLEKYINNNDDAIKSLIKCAVTHYQFEAIHPYGDGNGRAGRILLVLQMIQYRILILPILYMSDYINKRKSDYYKLLLNVTRKGDWVEYILFMLLGFEHQARKTRNTILEISVLYQKVKNSMKQNHRKIYSVELVESLFSQPIVTPIRLGKSLGVHYTTASRYLKELSKSGLLSPRKSGKYQFFFHTNLIKILMNAGKE